mmetsp:Transcript_23106/g.35456  ORF Transcript_23106/g.35456 Transcript_23106/m.35456 type:complete len:85 (-) Transcript_23106:53-307(-)
MRISGMSSLLPCTLVVGVALKHVVVLLICLHGRHEHLCNSWICIQDYSLCSWMLKLPFAFADTACRLYMLLCSNLAAEPSLLSA